jgi:hypothetical protein
MANSLLSIDMITRESLRVAHESLQFIATTDRQYDDAYGKTGAKIGSVLRVRKPNQYKRTTGSRVMDVQDQSEASGSITLATQDHVDMRFNSAELALTIDDFSRRYIEPAVKVLVSGIEADYLAFATKATAQVAGTAGTAITSLSVPGAARAKLNQQLAPKSDRYIQMDSVTMGGLVNGVASYFNPSNAIANQFREGMVARTAMADYYENERVWTLPNAADVAGEINGGTLTSGITSLTVDGLTAAPVAGMVFTIEGTYDVHPETKVAYPHLKQFVCSAGCTTTNLVFTPAVIWDTSDPRQNCSGQPTDNDDITFVGAASTNYVQPLMYHKEAFQFVTADLPIMDDAAKCVRRTQDGLSLRVWQASDIRNDEQLMRIDILYGMAALRPEWACRLIGAAG